MPTYEYRCENCGKFELQQSIKDEPLKTCPDCQGSVKRLISNNVGIIFKGSGFYVTDNRSKSSGSTSSSNGTAAKDGDSAKESSSKSETSSDTPAASTSPSDKAS